MTSYAEAILDTSGSFQAVEAWACRKPLISSPAQSGELMKTTCVKKLLVGRTKSGLLVRVEGQGTMRESRALDEFVATNLEDGICSLFVDLRFCEFLDSTFLGCLVVLQKRFRQAMNDRFRIIADDQRCHDLFAAMHLENFFSVTEHAPDSLGEMLEMTADDDDCALGRHVLRCHQQLADLGGPQQAIFRGIVAQLERELGE